MRRASTRLLPLTVLLGLVASCGGGSGGSSPTAPVVAGTPDRAPAATGWAVGVVVTAVSGETGAPVAGARVLVAGVEHTTDAAGQIVLKEAATDGATVDVAAFGFLPRQTSVRHASTSLTLWPDHARLPGSYTLTLLYTASTIADSSSVVPLERIPPRVKTIALVPSAELSADARVMAAHRQAADYFNVAVEGRTVFTVGGKGDLSVETFVAADDASCEGNAGRLLARRWATQYEVTRAQIIFCGAQPTRLPTPIAHELGHVFGLAHSRDDRDVMYPYYDVDSEHGFTTREELTMKLVYTRRGGNAWPDNDRAAATSGTRVRTFVD
jgi:matrixin